MASTARIAATLGLNLFSSLSIVFVNKWLFLYNKFPSITLTLINFVGTSFGLYVCLALGLFKRKTVHVRDVLPLAASFCGFVVFTNLSLKYNTVGTYQLLKVLTSPVILFLNYQWFDKTPSRFVVLSLLPIFLGVTLNSIFDLQFSPIGMLMALLGVGTTAMYQILVGHKQKELALDSMQLLSYQAPLSSVMLLCVLPFLEPPFAEGGLFAIDLSLEGFLLVCLSTSAAFLVNFTIYWIIGNTSPITYNFFGHFKFCATMIGGVLIFNDELQTNQYIGIMLTLIGVFSYSHLKMKERNQNTPLRSNKIELKP